MATTETLYRLTMVDNTRSAIAGIQRNLGGLKGAFVGLGAAISVRAFAQFISNTNSAIDEIAKLERRLGISTEALSEYKFVAQQTGVEFNQLTTAFQRLGRRVSEAAQGSGEAQGALKELGLSAKALNTLSIDEQFERVSEALGKVAVQTNRVRLSQKLFDSEGVIVLQTIDAQAEGLAQLREEARLAGASIDDNLAATSEELADTFGRLKIELIGLSFDILRTLAPALEKLGDFARLAVQSLRFVAEEIGLIERNIKRLTLGQLLLEQEKVLQRVAELEDKRARIGDRSRGRDKQIATVNKELGESQERLEKINAQLEILRGNASAATENPVPVLLEPQVDASAVQRTFEEVFGGDLFDIQPIIDAAIAEDLKRQEEEARAAAQSYDVYRRAIQRVGTRQEKFTVQLKDTLDELEKFPQAAELSQRLVAQVGIDYLDALEEPLVQTKESTNDLLESIKRNTDRFAQELTGAIFDAADSIEDRFRRLAETIVRDIFEKQIAAPLSDALGNLLNDVFSSDGGGGGGLGGLLSSAASGIGEFIGGLFQNSQGGLYKVAGSGSGERPVAFTAQPGEYVQVTPRGQQGGGGPVNINFTVNSLDPRDAASVIVQNRNTIISVVQGAFERTGRAPQVA